LKRVHNRPHVINNLTCMPNRMLKCVIVAPNLAVATSILLAGRQRVKHIYSAAEVFTSFMWMLRKKFFCRFLIPLASHIAKRYSTKLQCRCRRPHQEVPRIHAPVSDSVYLFSYWMEFCMMVRCEKKCRLQSWMNAYRSSAFQIILVNESFRTI
jgi:hypothetical protein